MLRTIDTRRRLKDIAALWRRGWHAPCLKTRDEKQRRHRIILSHCYIINVEKKRFIAPQTLPLQQRRERYITHVKNGFLRRKALS